MSLVIKPSFFVSLLQGDKWRYFFTLCDIFKLIDRHSLPSVFLISILRKMNVFGLEFQFDLYSESLSTCLSLADIKT